MVVCFVQAFGPLKRVTAGFSFFQDDPSNIRASPTLEPLGCLGDLGWCVGRHRLAVFACQPLLCLPLQVHNTIHLVGIQLRHAVHGARDTLAAKWGGRLGRI